MIFMAKNIGPADMKGHMECLVKQPKEGRPRVICLDRTSATSDIPLQGYYDEFLGAASYSDSQRHLEEAERKVSPDDVINLQFTSGKLETSIISQCHGSLCLQN